MTDRPGVWGEFFDSLGRGSFPLLFFLLSLPFRPRPWYTGKKALSPAILSAKEVSPLEAIICIQPDPPRFDAIPTYKITCYPLEKRDYKPFAQAQVCLAPGELWLRLWAFEARPRPGSQVEAVLAPGEGDGLVRLSARADGSWRCVWRRPDGEEEPLEAAVRPMAGDDFQGEYWGVSAALPRPRVEQALGPLEAGSVVLGNFYKRSRDPDKPHHGSCWPADFAGGREYEAVSLVPFTVVRY